MGQELELDFEKYCILDGSPTTVLLSARHSKLEKRKVRNKPKCGNEVIFTQNNDFTEISLHRYRSQSCKDIRSTKLQVNKALKRGSVYQSSNEVSEMNKISEKETEGRQKIEFSRVSAPSPFNIFESLCDLDDDDSTLGSFSESSLNSINKQEDQEPLPIPLNKSLSSRLELPHSPAKITKNRFSPFKNPFVKSKSEKSRLGSSAGLKNISLQKSLIHDFSYNDSDSRCLNVSSSSLPGHLNGVLKMQNKSQMPCFEFLVKNRKDILVGKKSKVGNGCDWVYTFHTAQNKRRDFKDYTIKDITKTVGEMRVSCYLCTELVNADNSMVTEFVVHDLASEGISVKSNESKDLETLETAAIVIQFPSEKRESLKCNQGDMKNDDLLNFSAKVSVVIPSANHGLPSGESRGASPLLDRWRLGGGCDCGGWDMGCPLIVLSNPNIQKEEPVKLFLKGSKENTQALTMKMTMEGEYSVDFHERLTSLQAFSICVAILHSTERSTLVDHDKDREILQCDSMRVFVEDEVKHLIEAVVEEDKRKPVKNEFPPSFLINPPFSPMSRA